jgi:hypothetical protein
VAALQCPLCVPTIYTHFAYKRWHGFESSQFAVVNLGAAVVVVVVVIAIRTHPSLDGCPAAALGRDVQFHSGDVNGDDLALIEALRRTSLPHQDCRRNQ